MRKTRLTVIALILLTVPASDLFAPVHRRFPQRLDDAPPGRATQQNPLFTGVLASPMTSKWEKVDDNSYVGPTTRIYIYDADNGTFEYIGMSVSEIRSMNSADIMSRLVLSGSPAYLLKFLADNQIRNLSYGYISQIPVSKINGFTDHQLSLFDGNKIRTLCNVVDSNGRSVLAEALGDRFFSALATLLPSPWC